jgi:transposase-like protein
MEKDIRREVLAAGLGGTEGGRRPTGVPPSPAAAAGDGRKPEGAFASDALVGTGTPDPEVLEKPVRRRFTADYKLRLLREADACRQPGQLGALLRREGLYASHLTTWRRQRDAGALAALRPKRRGRKVQSVNPLAAETERLRRENQRLAARLRQAETIIDVQKKVSEMLGLTLPPTERST